MLMIDVPVPLLWFGAFISTAGGVWFLFDRAETVVRPEAKASISRWLNAIDPASTAEN